MPSKTADMASIDREREAAIDASTVERNKTLTPNVEYGWETARRESKELDRQREHWYNVAMKYTGIAAHYKRALEEVCSVYAHTSSAGDSMTRIAHAALDREYVGGFGRK